MSLIKKLKNFITQEISWTWILLIFLADLLFSIVILKKVPYTEIDWIAYMEEVEGYLSGERDYLKIRGCTGPLVYPAGFLYIFSYLYYLTDSGKNIFYGQIIFTILYLLQLLFILYLYYITSSLKNYHFNIINKIDKKKNNKEEEDEDIEIKKNINYDFKSPIYLCFILILSKRLHSIYILRLFNDTFAIFFGYLSIILFSFSYYTIGSLIFSFAVSIKMNLLLFSPGILLLYLLYKGNKNNYYSFPIIQIILCGILQIIIGLPFLLTYPISYILKAFELTRVFDYKWTVNYKFLTENLFYNKKLSILLLLLTVISYVAFYWRWITQYKKGLVASNPSLKNSSVFGLGQKFSPRFVFYLIASSNIIGITFARSLHYQFYSWYFHSIPFILYNSKIPFIISSIFMFFIEYAYNVFPATSLSSLLLQLSHLYLLISIWTSDCCYHEGYYIGLRLKNKDIKQE